jgi:G:T-mismatch repair DNA endonuclease (very short patch repair protein)
LTKICSVKECNNKHMAKGFCQKHYDKFRLYGNPLHVVDPKETGRKISEANRGRPSPMKGKKQTEESKRKISEASKGKNLGKRYPGELNPFFGKKHSDKSKRIMSELKKGKETWNKGKVGIYSKETLEKMSKASKIIQNRPEVKRKNIEAHKGNKASIQTKKKLSEYQNRSDVIQANRERRSKINIPFKDSLIELQTQKILTNAGIKFEKHVRIKFSNRFHKADILIRPKKIIEVNGYFHFDPRIHPAEKDVTHRKKLKKPTEIWVEEKNRLNKIREIGYEILVIWDLDLKKDLEKTTKKILKFAKV